MNQTIRGALIVSTALLLGSMTINAFADEAKFDKNHPRRAEVNQRLENQNQRINKEVKEGEISKGRGCKIT